MRLKHKRVLRLRQLRRARELTQTQMAAKAGIALSNYSAIETGRQNPNLVTAKAIAEVFGESIETVFEYVQVAL